MTDVTEGLRELFAVSPDAMRDPYPLYRELRQKAPVHVFDDTTVIVSTHAEAKAVYRDNGRFPNPEERGSQFTGRLRLLSDEDLTRYADIIEFERSYMTFMNGERHQRVRSAGKHAFTPRRLGQMRIDIQRLTEELLDELEEQNEPDFIAFAYQLPLLVIMDMMGVPREDATMLKHWGDALNAPAGESPLRPETVNLAHQAVTDFEKYVCRLVELHRDDPDPTTLVGALLNASSGDQLTDEELIGTYVLFLFAGHETTTNMFGNGLLALLQHRDQWELLCSDPSSLVESTIEEVLRYDSPVQFFRKYTVEDQILTGVKIPAGRFVVIANGAANRDPLAFRDPDRLDITRHPNDHLSFGYGIHFCVGAGLTRLEGQIGFAALARRFPDLELATSGTQREYNHQFSLRGLATLPVELARRTGDSAGTRSRK